jgi:hypothetical protein
MANYTFDPTIREITLDVGAVELDVKDLYSRWKEWFKDTDGGKDAIAFSSVGGDTIDAVAGTEIPAYIYLQNGWRIHPDEADHTLNVTNGVLLVEGGGDPFVDTTGAYTVRINYQQPVQAITVPGLILGEFIESSVTMEQALRLMLAALAGKLSGAPGGPIVIRDVNDTKDRITATVDANGNRTAVTTDAD